MDFLQIHNLLIPLNELTFTAARSSGPGGQNVNKVSSKVIVAFDVARSSALSQEQKDLLLQKLSTRLTNDGVLTVSAQESRSQHANRQIAVQKLQRLLEEALRPVRKRRRTGVPTAARYARLQAKKHRAQLKALRRPPEL